MAFEQQRIPERQNVREHIVEVDDDFTNESFDFINDEVMRLAEIGGEYYTDAGSAIERKRTSKIDMSNPATSELLGAYPSFADWLATVPTAAALDPLYDPNALTLPNGHPIDRGTADWFRNIADARGIRSRATAMKEMLKEEALQSPHSQQWLSLACGAAQPVLSVMRDVQDQGVPTPSVTLVDIDKKALSLARSYADQHGLDEDVATKRLNVLSRNGLAYRREQSVSGVAKAALLRARGRLAAESFDAVDAVGILEYLKRPDWKYTYNGVMSTTHKMAGAETFLENAYELVKPGGILIIGNMLDTHPQLGFTLDVVQWPHIQPRSVNEMVDIINTANIHGDIDVYKPSDGVYALYGIRKPSE